MADSTLQTIRIKVRRLTRSLSEAQLPTSQIDDYINTFILYDLPEHLRLFNLKKTFSFYTEPYVDTYETNTVDAAAPLYNFKNKYITVHPPFYVAGNQAQFLEDRAEFFNAYPMPSSVKSVSTGDGVTTTFTGTVPGMTGTTSPGDQLALLRNNILFSSIDSSGEGLTLIDYPVSNTTGALGVPGTPQVLPSPFGQIDYTTGVYTVVFGAAPGSGQSVDAQVVIVQPSRPQSILFFDGAFTVRPVPDQPYKIDMEVFARPTAFIDATDTPQLEEWWQYIAYGAARKIFQDRMDMESLSMIDPEYRKQENLITRRTIVQQTSQRTSTIYTDTTGNGIYGQGWFSNGGTY